MGFMENYQIDLHYQEVGKRYDRLYEMLFGKHKLFIVNYLIKNFLGRAGGKKIADVGGGTGELIEQLKEHTPPKNTYILVDPYASMLDQAKLRKNKPDEIIQSKAEDFINRSEFINSLDLIICKEMIHHVSHLSSFFEGVKKILKKGGHLFILTRPLAVEFPFGKNGQRAWKESYPVPPQNIPLLLKEKGFSVKEETQAFPIQIDKASWLEMIGDEPLFSHIKAMSNAERLQDLKEEQERPEKVLIFNDLQLYITAWY